MIYKIKDPKDGHIIVVDPDIDVYGRSKIPKHFKGAFAPSNPQAGEVISVSEACRRGLIPLGEKGVVEEEEG